MPSILVRLKDELNLSKDVDLADFLGVAQNTISAWKKRNSVNYDLIFEKIAPYNIDLNWLVYGKDSPQPPESEVKLLENIKETRQIMNLTDTEENVINVIEIVQRLPWSTSTRRILMENYLYLVYKEQVDQSRKSS